MFPFSHPFRVGATTPGGMLGCGAKRTLSKMFAPEQREWSRSEPDLFATHESREVAEFGCAVFGTPDSRIYIDHILYCDIIVYFVHKHRMTMGVTLLFFLTARFICFSIMPGSAKDCEEPAARDSMGRCNESGAAWPMNPVEFPVPDQFKAVDDLTKVDLATRWSWIRSFK